MEKHLTAFVDILGFTDAIKSATASNDDDAIGGLTRLLQEAVLQNSNSGFAIVNGETRGAPNPAFSSGHLNFSNDEPSSSALIQESWTAFSDCIVISYPFKDLASLGLPEMGQLNSALDYLADKIAQIAVGAAKLDLLVRGGIATGPLYHENGVVLGKAMIDAYELERKVANYPRVVLSADLSSRVRQPNPKLLTDEDGIVHLNYFEPMIRFYALGETGESFDHQRKAAQDKLLKTVEKKIGEYRDKGEDEDKDKRDLQKQAKWTWFKNRLEQACVGLPEVLRQDHQSK